METIQISVKLSREVFEKLQKAAESGQKSSEDLAAEIIAGNLPLPAHKPATTSMPGVALLKGDYSPGVNFEHSLRPNTTFSNIGKSGQTDIGNKPGLIIAETPTVSNLPSPEKLQKRQELQTKIKELSLLIDTAEPEKKEDYLLQYALLTAELDSII